MTPTSLTLCMMPQQAILRGRGILHMAIGGYLMPLDIRLSFGKWSLGISMNIRLTYYKTLSLFQVAHEPRSLALFVTYTTSPFLTFCAAAHAACSHPGTRCTLQSLSAAMVDRGMFLHPLRQITTY